MRKKLELAIKIFIYATFLVPLVVIPSSFIFPFIVPKMVFLRTLIEAMLGAYVLLLIINWKEYKPQVTPLTLAVFMFYIVSFGISTFVGTDPYHSFWDNHERMLGFFTILHYFAYYILCSKFFRTWTEWKWALRFFLFAGTAVMFIGMLQVGNPQLLLNQGSNRVASTLGNPIYVGGYGLFLLFSAFLLAMKEKNRIWTYVYAFLMIFSVLGIFYSGTRGAMLGLLAGVGTMMLVYALALKNYPKIRYTLFALMALVVLAVGVLYINRQTTFVSNIPSVGRAINTSLTEVMASPRWIAWEIAWSSFLEKPFFGWGPNNYFYAFNQHYNPRSLNFGYGETWFDNAHNIIMNTLAVQGALGILSYLALFGVGAYVLISGYRRKGAIDYHIMAVGCGFLAAHFVGNITVFENITSYLYFMFWLAMINSLATRTEASNLSLRGSERRSNLAESPGTPDRQIGPGIISTMALITFIVIFVCNIQPARANMKTLDAIKGLSTDPVLGLEKMKDAVSFVSPHIDDIRSDLSRTASQLLFSAGQNINSDLAKQINDICYAELLKNTVLHPLDIRNFISLAQIAQLKAYLDNSGQYLSEANMYLEKALVYSPRRQQVMYSLAMLKYQMGQTDLGVKLLEQAISDNSSIGESYWRLAYLYKLSGKMDKANEVMALAEKNGVIFNDQDNAALAQVFPPATTTPTATKK
ncbi:MAG: O-antigen ligase family protein [Candidatus Magasanikbacteria bacterium]|nr:O-antigen ligase family protein [Candidatus Magasanikbacteria bacterium]